MKRVIELYINKRCLLSLNQNNTFSQRTISEFKILEVSPSGNYVKLISIDGRKFWKLLTEISFIEELKDFKSEKKSEVEILEETK